MSFVRKRGSLRFRRHYVQFQAVMETSDKSEYSGVVVKTFDTKLPDAVKQPEQRCIDEFGNEVFQSVRSGS